MDKQAEIEKWYSDISQESLDKTAEFLPRLDLPKVGEKKKIKFVKEPRKVENEKLPKGSMWVAEVEHEGLLYDMICPNSLKFQLRKAVQRYNIDLVGSTFIVGASIGNTIEYQNVKLYFAQYVNTAEYVPDA